MPRGRPKITKKLSSEIDIQVVLEDVLKNEVVNQLKLPEQQLGLFPGLERKVGDEVYFLNSSGFAKGIIKSIIYTDTLNFDLTSRHAPTRETDISIRVVTNIHTPAKLGDLVPNHLLFNRYEEMVNFYSKNRVD